MVMKVQSGICKWFDVKKGFGFITPDNGEPDLFCHQSSLKCAGFRALAEGERVEYTVEVDSRSGKQKAINITGPNGSDCVGPDRNDYRDQPRGYDDDYRRESRSRYNDDADDDKERRRESRHGRY